jgi:hypothetical protein
VYVLGMTQVRQCCTFLWMQEASAQRRTVFTRPYHCAACVGEMARAAKLQRISLAGGISMDRIRAMLGRERAELVQRWDQQLQAVAASGVGIDGNTAVVLPELLDAADRALDRRYRSVPPDATRVDAAARRAAIQSSLLGDFLFDATLERMPELNPGEQRLLSDALSHASVEVLVKGALRREEQRQRKEAARLARLAHDLRDRVTAVQLGMDLVAKSLPESRAARTLERSVRRLREQVEDSLLDEMLEAGDLRARAVRLAPLLADLHPAAAAMGAEKKIKIILQAPPPRLSVKADPRTLGAMMRKLLQAALEVARRGSTIRVGTQVAREQARVAVMVDSCRRLPGNRQPDLPALSLARRAAKAQGGALAARVLPPGGAQLLLDLPRLQAH